jgi:endonuclease/exonuclease/phosphatase family metal-dependent hydrolase
MKKKKFYDLLTTTCNQTPRYNTLIVIGDFNAEIGKENFMKPVAGNFTIHEETNENGKHFAAMNNMIIKSTCFKYKIVHKGTWKVPGGEVNQIDHVLISLRRASNITDVRTSREPNCDSDHFLVKAVLRHRPSNTMKMKGSNNKLGHR